VEVSAAPWCLAGSRGHSAKEGIKYIAEATKVKALKAPPEKSLGTTMPKAVIGSALIRVTEHLKGFVYLLKLLLSSILVVTVRVILQSQPTKSPLYFLIGGISRDTEDLIIVTFYWHILNPIPFIPFPLSRGRGHWFYKRGEAPLKLPLLSV